MSCLRCNKPLKVWQSVQRGLGPICAAIVAAKDRRREQDEGEMGDKVDIPFDNETKDIVCRRETFPMQEFSAVGPAWRNHFNIHQMYRHHSPSGMNWGYGGSGPADFAMNILEIFMRERGEKANRKVRCYDDGETYDMPICESTLRLYQDFKRDVICGLPKEGGTIKGDDVRQWITANIDQGFKLAA